MACNNSRPIVEVPKLTLVVHMTKEVISKLRSEEEVTVIL